MFLFISFKKCSIINAKIILLFKFIKKCQKEILRCAPPSHVCGFSLNNSLEKLWKMFISSKKPFCSEDILIFLFLSSPLFFLVSHCFIGWSKINFRVYDIINCLNKDLITHFVWYFGKEKRYDIETLSIDRVLNKEHFHGKIMYKMWTKS